MDEPGLRARRALIPWRVRAVARFCALGGVAYLAELHGAPLVRAVRPLRVAVPVNASHAEVDARVGDALLVDHALRQGVAFADPIVREALVSDMQALGGDARSGDAELVERALARGLADSDAFVRGRLRSLGEALVLRALPAHEPGDAELAAYLAQHAARYGALSRWSVSLVGLAPASDAAKTDARLAALRAGASADELHELALLPTALHAQSAAQLAAKLGSSAAEAVTRMATGAWHGPLPSPYGPLLVRVDAQIPAAAPPLAQLRARLLADLRHDARAARLARALAELQRRRGVHVERR